MSVCVCHTELLSVLASAHWLGVCKRPPGELSWLIAMLYLETLRPLTNSIRLIVIVEAQLLAGSPTYTQCKEKEFKALGMAF